ncbi:MAG: AMP-binding protein, partial [Planctomycetaceae bacterium]
MLSIAWWLRLNSIESVVTRLFRQYDRRFSNRRYDDTRITPPQGREENLMGAGRIPLRDFADSPLPVTPVWDAPGMAWHGAYPEGIPPRIEFEAVRVERLLEAAVDRYPERLALRYFKTAWTYRELLMRVKIVAASLQRIGLRRGSRLMLVLPNCPEFIVLWFAAHWLGAEVVPVNPLVSSGELVHLANKCGVDTVVGLDVRLRPVAKMSEQVELTNLITVSLAPHLPWFLAMPYRLQKLIKGPVTVAAGTTVMDFREFCDTTRSINLPALDDVDQPAVMQPTGGTTGSSKVAVLTHRNLCSNVAQLHTWSGLEPGQDTFLS